MAALAADSSTIVAAGLLDRTLRLWHKTLAVLPRCAGTNCFAGSPEDLKATGRLRWPAHPRSSRAIRRKAVFGESSASKSDGKHPASPFQLSEATLNPTNTILC